MNRALWLIALFVLLLAGCAQPSEQPPAAEPEAPTIQLEVQAPEPLPIPDYVAPSSDEDWVNKVNNKEREVLEVINVINPVAAYITVGFEQYGERFSDTLNEEWEDTQVQLTKALTLYDDCKARREAGTIDKKLFLDMEEVWQLLVKTGVAGVRAKSMVDSELKSFTG